MDDPTLNKIQDWTKEVLIRRGNLTEKIESAQKMHGLEINQLIKSAKGVSAERRLGIYTSGYVLRLLECLQADYPSLSVFMTEDIFKLFGQAYIVSQPSESYSLSDFTTLFPEYLKTTRPKNIDEQKRALFELPEEIAFYERAGAECSIAKGLEGEELIRPQMFELMQDDYTYSTPDCVRLIRAEYPIIEYIKQLQDGNKDPIPERKKSFVGFARRNYHVRSFYLEDWQYYFIESCRTETNLNDALDRVSGLSNLERSSFATKLMIWIPSAIELGFVRIV